MMVVPGVVSPKFVYKIAKEQMQILRLTTPNSTPKSRDRSLGTPELRSVWGPFRSG
jgi:hypothetical protein